MWGAAKGKGKGKYDYGSPYGGGGMGAMMGMMEQMMGAKGMGKWGGGDPWAFEGGGGGGYQAPKQRAGVGNGDRQHSGRPGGVPKEHNSWNGDIDGLEDALGEAFTSAGVSLEDPEVVDAVKKIEASARKTAKKFYNDERFAEKMTNAQARAFVGEFVEAVMSAFSNTCFEKPWFEKVSWNGVLLMVALWGFKDGKLFTRVLKSQLMEFIDDGLLAWSEEERCTRAMWSAVESINLKSETQMKKVNTHLTKAFDDAHFNAPFGSTNSAALGLEVAALQDFVKGWMTIFAGKAWGALENGLEDGGASGQTAAVTVLFQHLLDPNNACLPLSLQPSLPPAPWSFIEETATEVIAELTAGKPSAA